MVRRSWLLVVLALWMAILPGCELFRLEVGSGIGIGADVKVPGIYHGGVSVGVFDNVGPLYAYGSSKRGFFFTLPFWHIEDIRGKRVHSCLLFPWLIEDTDGSATVDADGMTWALEVGVMLLLLDLRMGINVYPYSGMTVADADHDPADPDQLGDPERQPGMRDSP